MYIFWHGAFSFITEFTILIALNGRHSDFNLIPNIY